MVEIVSALAGRLHAGAFGQTGDGIGVTLREVKGRDLVQVGAWPDTSNRAFAQVAAELALPEVPDPRSPEGRRSIGNADVTLFRVGPDKVWLSGPYEAGLGARLGKLFTAADAVVTELGHSRTTVRLLGPKTRDVLAQLVAIDLDPMQFPPGSFAATGIHHVGCLVHYARDLAGNPVFDLYLPRSFAASLVEGIELAALPYGLSVEA